MRPLDHSLFDHDLLQAEHRQIMAVATDLLASLDAAPLDVARVVRLRWKLAHQLAVHLAREDRCVYPVLGRHADRAIAALATAFAAEMGGLAGAYRGYMERWNAASIEADAASFAADTRAVMAALHQRVEREETQLYPRLIG